VDPITGDEVGPVLESTPMWDYRIKVDPWQVFGTIELEIVGTDIVVEHIWAANVLDMNEGPTRVAVKLELDNTPQDDQQFDIDGTGIPTDGFAVIRCVGLEPVESDCKLGIKYNVLNTYQGVISSKLTVNTWQDGAKVKLQFGSETQISEVWGAQLLDVEEEAMITEATFRLLPYNHHTPLDRRSAFGFDATPPFHQIPTISCIPSHPFPPPPPPTPPLPPPAPPPFFVSERSDCFLGGRLTFVTAPSDIPGALWEVNVKMHRWEVGAQLTLNFYGDQLKKHPLRIKTVEPDDAVEQVSTTAHSTIVQLKNSPVREFNIRAYGMVDGLGKLACCCAPVPSPPPPPPLPPPSPSPPPSSPRPPPGTGGSALGASWGRGIIGHAEVFSPPPSPPPEEMSKTTTNYTVGVMAYVATFGIVGYVLRKLMKLRKNNKKLPTLAELQAKGGKRIGAPAAGLRRAIDDIETAPITKGGGTTTKLHIEISASERTSLKISLEGITCMEELQELVAEVCDEAGFRQLDDLILQYKRPDGKFATVTRSVTIKSIKTSPALRLAPAGSTPSKGSAKKNKYSKVDTDS